MAGYSKIGNAITWIKGELAGNPEVDRARKLKLINEASLKFDLSPKDQDYLQELLETTTRKTATKRSKDSEKLRNS